MLDRALLRLSGMRTTLALTCVLVLVRAACIVGQALSLARLIVVLWEGAAVSDVTVPIIFFFVCFVLRQVVVAVQDAYLERYAAVRAEGLRDDLLGAIYGLGSEGARRHGSPALVAAAIEGIDDIETYIALMVPKIASVVVIPIVLLCVAFPLDWVSGVIMLVCLPVIVLFMVLIGRSARDEAAKRHGEFDRMSNHFIDSLRGIDTLKAFGRSRSWAERVYAASERFRELTLRTLRIATLSSAVLDLIAMLGLAAVAIMLGFRLADGSLAFLPTLAVLVMVPEFFRPVREFAADYHASLDGRNSLAEVLQVIDEGRAVQASGAEGERGGAGGGRDAAGCGACGDMPDDARRDAAKPVESSRPPSISLRSVSYAYDGGAEDGGDAHEAIADVSFDVAGPCKVGIIGTSGAGKSTLMNILAGFADPSGGSIAVDDADLPTLDDADWHVRSAFISQDPYIFRMTLRDNVAFYHPDATDEEVVAALERAGLGELPEELDQGLDTVIGDGARTLSGGQMQRVALARALVDERRQVLLFDEPTAHLDIETEMDLKQSMLPLMEGKLVFFATHRLHWVADMDYLIELDGGRIVWQGAASEWPHAADAASDAEAVETAMADAATVDAAAAEIAMTGAATSPSPAGAGAAANEAGPHMGAAPSAAGAEDGVPADAADTAAEDAAAEDAAPGEEHPTAVARDGDARTSDATPSASSSASACATTSASSSAPPSRLWRTWRSDTWVRPYFTRYGGVMVLAILLGLVSFIFSGALMFTSGYMISLAAMVPVTVLALHLPSLFVRIFGIGEPILGYLERLTSHDWVLRMTSDLRRRLYLAFDRIAPTSRARMGLGRAHALLADDIGHVQDLYLRTVFPLVCAWVLCVIVVIAAGIFSLPLACALLVLLVVDVVVVPLVSVRMNGARMLRAREAHARLYDELTDDVLGVQDWVLSGRREDYLARHRKTRRLVRDLNAATKRACRIRDIIVQAVFGLCAVVLIVWAGEAFSAVAGAAQTGAVAALSNVGGELAPAYAPNWIAAFVLCFFPLIEAFAPASDAAMGLVTHSDAVAHLNDLPDPDEDEEDASRAAGEDSAFRADDEPSSSGVSHDAPSACDVVFDGVSFRYEEGADDVLRDIDLVIPAGQKLAVLGRSGAGKSTLALLLHGGASPDAGHVLVGGLDASMQRGSTSLRVGVVEQHPHLFNQTLRENLLIGREDADDDELRSAMKAVGLGNLLGRLPQGLDTMVDESGRRFSGGERHRVALARVLLSHVPVVVFDEPFADLDPATESALLDTILDTLADKTVILITHHLQGVSQMDRVVFVEDGAIALDGTPDALVHESARYRQLVSFERGS